MTMSERINYREFSIAREALPLIKIRAKKISSLLSKKSGADSGRVLVVDTCIIGDFMHTLPSIMEIIKRGKDVDLIVSSPVKPIAERISGIGKVFVAKTSYNREIEGSGNGTGKGLSPYYKKIVILRISPEAYSLIKNIKFSEMHASDWVYLKYLLHMAKNILIRRPIKQSREVAFEIINVKKARERIDKGLNLKKMFKFNKRDYRKVSKIPELRTTDKIILIHTGSGWASRLWKDDKWVGLIKEINHAGRPKFRFIFIGSGGQEKKSFDYIRKKTGLKVYSLIGKLDLKELFLVMKKSDYFIGVDSGPRNLAHFADLRSVSLRGPGTYFMPLNKKDIVIDNIKGRSAMPFFSSEKSSVSAIAVENVFDEFKRVSGIK